MMQEINLILLRHGQAEDPGPGSDDFMRPLTSVGKGEAAATAKGLCGKNFFPQAIICSSAQRTRETCEQVLKVLGPEAPGPWYEPGLYHASDKDALELLRNISDEESTVLVIGHNPTLSRLATFLTGERVQLATAEAVHLSIQGLNWGDGLKAPGIWTLERIWRL